MKSTILFAVILVNLCLLANASPLFDARFGSKPYTQFDMVLEKTFLQVDVLRLTTMLEPKTSETLADIVSREIPQATKDEAIANFVISQDRAVVRSQFLREIPIDKFLEGVFKNLDLVQSRGFITKAQKDEIAKALPKAYSFLNERNIQKDDEMYYMIDGERFRIVYKSFDGKILLDQKETGAYRGKSVLASYFLKGSEFRKGLIASIQKSN